MKKIFTLLAAALMSVGMYADPNIVTPTISGDLSFTESTTVTMECTSPNSDIYYTTDGVTDPRCDCAAAPEYTHPITITETTIIKAAAYDGNDWSAVAEVTFTKVPASDPATTVVTITQNDFPSWGESFTKDGVTVSAGQIDGGNGNILGGGSFSTTLGNFTQIEVSAIDVSISGEGWSGTRQKKTWTGNASSVSFSSYIMGDGLEVTLKFTIEEGGTTAVDNASADQAQAAKAKKIFRDNNVFIEKNGETFTLTGSKVK
ncbi:MAG: chitobiase/beta-hexosaminidase C-terminal domain-containing protein [Paludibacteraceae bacterium]|nr:chitobiase/beta-hexosaminidase C-terminal domain-containing protein [Paludibacteraceae bacterium]